MPAKVRAFIAGGEIIYYPQEIISLPLWKELSECLRNRGQAAPVCIKAENLVQPGMTVKSLSLAPDYPPGKAHVVPPRSPDIGLAASQTDEILGPDVQWAPVTLPSGSEPLATGSEPSDI